MGANQVIEKQHIILCEGRDAENFLKAYLKYLDGSAGFSVSSNIQIINFGGNDDLSKFLRTFTQGDSFSMVKHLAVIRDAETDAQSACAQINAAFNKSGLAESGFPGNWSATDSSPVTGYLLFPQCDVRVVNGTLEDLCIELVAKEHRPEVIPQIDAFMACLEKECAWRFGHRFKTRLHMFFALSDRFVGMKLGEAANAQAFDFSSPKLDYLRDFVLAMFASSKK